MDKIMVDKTIELVSSNPCIIMYFNHTVQNYMGIFVN